ncbi:MAG TPA: hypothetical protein VF070_43630 [Streptosporangiaceae bacterium]
MGAEGNWKLKVQTPMGEKDWMLEIKVTGDTASGQLTTTTESTGIEEGTLTGNQLSWTSVLTQPRSAKVRGVAVFDGDDVTGEFRLGAFITRTFSGSRIA